MKLNPEQKNNLKKILKKHNIKKTGIFGSYAREEASNKSDLDLIVKFPKKDLFELISIKQDIEEELNLSVNIIPYDGLIKFSRKKRFKKEILNEQEIIL